MHEWRASRIRRATGARCAAEVRRAAGPATMIVAMLGSAVLYQLLAPIPAWLQALLGAAVGIGVLVVWVVADVVARSYTNGADTPTSGRGLR